MEPTMAPTNTPAPVFPSCDSADDSERTITGQIFVDENGNGQFDGTEQVFPNIIVILIDISSEWQTLTLTVTTDENGIYCFRNVPAAGYILSYAIPPGYITSGATNFTIDTSEGDVQAPNLGLTQEESLDVAIFLPLFTQNNVVK